MNAPKYELTLPSGKTVKYRPFLVKEERLLLMANEEGTDVNDIVCQIIESCTFNAFSAKSLSAADLEWLMLHIKIKSKGAESSFELKCNNVVDDNVCGQKIPVTLNIEEHAKIEGAQGKPVVMLDGENGLKLKEISAEAALRIEKIESFALKTFEGIYESIDSFFFGDEVIQSKDVSKESLIDFIDNVSEDSLKKIIDKMGNFPKVVVMFDFKCPKCQHSETIDLRGMTDFLD